MMCRALFSVAGLAGLALLAVSPAQSQEIFTRKGQVPLVGSDQASRDAKPLVAGAAVAAKPEMAPARAAPEVSDGLIGALSGVKHGRDGKDQLIELAPKVQQMLKQHGITPKPVSGDSGKLVQIKNSRVSPYAAIGVVATGCTGAVIMKRFVITVPWCVYNSKDKKFYDNLDFTPAVNGGDEPVGTVKWKNVWIAKGYQETGNLDYAYALIELDEDIGDKVGWFGFGPTKDSGQARKLVLSGYPFDGVPQNTLWETRCNIDSSEENAYFYHCGGKGKTIVSMGGSPLYAKATDATKADQLLGLHASSQNDKQDSFWAMKLNDSATQTLLSWANEGSKTTTDPQPDANAGEEDGDGQDSGTTPQCTCDQGDN